MTATAAALGLLQAVDELAQPRSGVEPELGVKKLPVADELADGLRLVALGKVHLNKGGPGALGAAPPAQPHRQRWQPHPSDRRW